MYILLLIPAVVFSLPTTTCGFDLHETIAAFVDGTARRSVSCHKPDYRNALYIVKGHYGYECYSSDQGSTYEMTFSQCIFKRDPTRFTTLSDKAIVKIALRLEYDGPANVAMYEVCQFIGEHASDLSIMHDATTSIWDHLVGDYPNGVYDVAPVESGGRLNNFKYSATNLQSAYAAKLIDLNILFPHPCANSTSRLFNQTYFVSGAELYGCVEDYTTPQLIGCYKPPEVISNEIGYTMDNFAIHEKDTDVDLFTMRSLYAFLGFRSNKRPMAEIGSMTQMQLCARIAAELPTSLEEKTLPNHVTARIVRNRRAMFLHRFPISWTTSSFFTWPAFMHDERLLVNSSRIRSA